MTRAAALLRVSTQKQVRRHAADEQTLPVQRVAVRQFVERRPGWTLVSEFAEEGVSAWSNSSTERATLQSVLQEARNGGFDALVVFKYDRLSRVSLEYPALLSQLHRIGVSVWSVADDGAGRELKIDGQMDKLLRFVEGWQAETESYNTSIRVSAKMRQMAERGIWTGGRTPYGFRLRNGGRQRSGETLSLEIDEGEAAVVRLMFDGYLDDGLGSSRIAARLNAQGLRRRSGTTWVDGSVREIMQNPIVAGRPAYGRTYTNPMTKRQNVRRRGSPEIILAPEVVAALEIVPWDRWERANRRMHAYNRARPDPVDDGALRHSRAEASGHLLTGLLECGSCGGPITGMYSLPKHRCKDGRVSLYRYGRYICRNAKGGAPCPAPQRSYGSKKLDGLIVGHAVEALARMDSSEIAEAVRERVRQDAWSRSTRETLAARKVERAERLFNEWTKRLNAHLLSPDSSLYSEEFIAEQVRQAEGELTRARRERGEAARGSGDAASRARRLEDFLSQATRFWERFVSASLRDQKRLLGLLISRIVVNPSGVEIHWRIDLEALAGGGGSVEWRETVRWRDGAAV